MKWRVGQSEYIYEGPFDVNGNFTGMGNFLLIQANFMTPKEDIKENFLMDKSMDMGFIITNLS